MNNDFFKSLERSISSNRISTYKSKNHSEIETISDYVLNAKISQNFYFLLQNLEVSLRNAIYDSFKKNYPNSDFFIYLKIILLIDIKVRKKSIQESVGKCYVA